MAKPRPLSFFGAWLFRQQHRWDWTFDPAASAGDSSVRIRREVGPAVTAGIRRLQKMGTGGWNGRRMLDHTSRMTLANVSGIAVGYAYLVEDLEQRDGWSLLDDVVVDASMRNRGIGHSLIAEMAAWLHADGYTTVHGHAAGSGGIDIEGGLTGWYPRMGFEMSGTSGGLRADVATLAQRTAHFRIAKHAQG